TPTTHSSFSILNFSFCFHQRLYPFMCLIQHEPNPTESLHFPVTFFRSRKGPSMRRILLILLSLTAVSVFAQQPPPKFGEKVDVRCGAISHPKRLACSRRSTKPPPSPSASPRAPRPAPMRRRSCTTSICRA